MMSQFQQFHCPVDLTPDNIYMLQPSCECVGELFSPDGHPNALPYLPTTATDPGAMPEESTKTHHPCRSDETRLRYC